MIRFIGRWVADCVELTCMLAGALLLMQVPALTHSYAVSLLQVAQAARRDIDQRENDARQYYHLPPDSGEQAVITALRPVEPSNAEALQRSVSRASMFDTTQAELADTAGLLQPLRAAWDAAVHPDPDKLTVLRTSVATYVPQIALDSTSLIYGIAGLVVGGLIGHSLSAAPVAVASLRRARRPA